MYIIKSIKDLEMLVGLYSIKRGTLEEIAYAANVKLSIGRLYKWKAVLVNAEILEPDKFVVRENREVAVYKINHKKIDDFLFSGELVLYKLYERFKNGYVRFLPEIKYKPIS